MARTSTARPSKAALDQIVNHGRSVVPVTHNGQARMWLAFRVPADQTPEGTLSWTVRLVGGWPEETLATYDVTQYSTGHISCLAEGWQDRMAS